jgi:hypothetical protein
MTIGCLLLPRHEAIISLDQSSSTALFVVTSQVLLQIVIRKSDGDLTYIVDSFLQYAHDFLADPDFSPTPGVLNAVQYSAPQFVRAAVPMS